MGGIVGGAIGGALVQWGLILFLFRSRLANTQAPASA
jgi:hypothetical protein